MRVRACERARLQDSWCTAALPPPPAALFIARLSFAQSSRWIVGKEGCSAGRAGRRLRLMDGKRVQLTAEGGKEFKNIFPSRFRMQLRVLEKCSPPPLRLRASTQAQGRLSVQLAAFGFDLCAMLRQISAREIQSTT